ncbi:FMS-like tyrosine kinase 4 [Cricetulus griseus]
MLTHPGKRELLERGRSSRGRHPEGSSRVPAPSRSRWPLPEEEAGPETMRWAGCLSRDPPTGAIGDNRAKLPCPGRPGQKRAQQEGLPTARRPHLLARSAGGSERGGGHSPAVVAAAARSGLRESSAPSRGRRTVKITPGLQAQRRALAAPGRSARGRARSAALSASESAGTGTAGRVALTMVSCWDTAVLLCVLLGCLLRTGSGSGSKLKGPELSLKGTQHVMQAGQTLFLKCRGEAAHSWSLPATVSKEEKRLSVTRSACGRNNRQFCSTLTLNMAQANHTGLYTCRYLPKSASKKKKTESAIYIFVSDAASPFIEMYSDIPKVVYMTEGRELIIPCRVTSPNITVTLKKFPSDTLTPDGERITWDSRKGFIITNATYREIGLLNCEATVNGRLYQTNYLTHRQTNTILDVRISPSSPVRLLRGQTLVLNCTTTTDLNTRVQMSWNYPGKATKRASIRQRIDQSNPHNNVFHSVLKISDVQSHDKGLYTCRVKSGSSFRSFNASVHVYGKGFISVKHRKQQVQETIVGKRSYRLSMKVKAFPSPEVVWLKDGSPATEKSARYSVHGYSLVIKDVTTEDAGDYTILLGIKQSNLFKNLTATLIVNAKPQIYEKSVSSFASPALYPLGSRQALTCTVYGIPQPAIKWLWHPCYYNHSKERYDFCSKSEDSSILDPDSNVGNRIESITQRMMVIEGTNKTVSTLVVADSRTSGIYSCKAFNKIGTVERNIKFYVTGDRSLWPVSQARKHLGHEDIQKVILIDVPNGFHISLEKMPTEGEDLKLSCTVNKFLYRDITWILLRTVNNRTMQHSISKQKMATTQEYSITLNLVIKNVSLEDSGTYACRARNTYTGEEILRKTEVLIRDQEAPHLLQNLSDHKVSISGSTTLDCQASGVPQPQIIWFKNNHKIQQEPGIILGPGNSTLFIERVTEEDEGVYRCRATNQKGAVESSAYLTVQGSSDKSNLELITLTCTCVAATLFWLLLTLFIRKLKRPSSEVKTDYLSIIMDPDEVPLDEQCERLPYDASKWEFARERLKLGKSLGRGAFGKVVQASAFGIKKSPTCRTVAVKMLKEGATASEYKALMTELKILTHIGHHLNVVNLLGACTKQGGPLMVIVEYCKYGNLSNYLKSKRDLFFLNKEAALHTEPKKENLEPGLEQDQKPRLDSVSSGESFASSGFQEDKSVSDTEEDEDCGEISKQPLTMEDLISYSFQVARGMEFLSSRKCIHRDLAARNILLSENNVVKICDFGLARDIYKNPDYVRKGDTRLPLKWMAPESIFDKIYSTKSDVWSYGVLLWEIFSLGGSPYPGVQMDEDFCSRLKEGMRMRAPEYATPEIYQIMLDCWHKDPKERPRFAELVEKLGDLLQANVQQDYQLDTSTLLASPLLKRFTWTESKPKASMKIDLRITSKSKESGLSDVPRPSFCFSSCGHIRPVHDDDDSELGKDSCCSPPPDYNSVVLYSSPPA